MARGEGGRDRGRPRKTLGKVVRDDFALLKRLSGTQSKDRAVGRNAINC